MYPFNICELNILLPFFPLTPIELYFTFFNLANQIATIFRNLPNILVYF